MPSRKKPARPARAREEAQADSLTLTDVSQVKVLANPLRIRILEEFCTAERTTKQVAQLLGEKPTKLYHHVEALERVGLIRLTRTRQNRGTIEKYYLAVAKQFRADSRIFAAAEPGTEEGNALQAMIATVFDGTASEMRDLVARESGKKGTPEKGVLTYLEVRTDRKRAKTFETRLMKLVKELEGPETANKKTQRRYRLTIAFYPLDAEATDGTRDAE